MGAHRPTVRYEIDVFEEQATATGGNVDLTDPVSIARAAYAQMTDADGMLPILAVLMPDGSVVDVDLDEVGMGDDDGAPCCLDPGCGGNPCEFPGYADNH